MIYGYRAIQGGTHLVIVTAGDTRKEYNDRLNEITNKGGFKEAFEPDIIDFMQNQFWEYMKEPPKCFILDEDQIGQFFTEHDIVELGRMAAIDQQIKMRHSETEEGEAKKKEKAKILAEMMGEEYKEKTIGELTGTDKYDPWAREKKDDDQPQIHNEDNPPPDTMGNSFGSAEQIKEQRKNPVDDGEMKLDQITAHFDEKGNMVLKNVFGRKKTTSDEKPDMSSKKSLFDDSDFAAFKKKDKDEDEE